MKKLLALILMAALCLGLLAGCGQEIREFIRLLAEGTYAVL